MLSTLDGWNPPSQARNMLSIKIWGGTMIMGMFISIGTGAQAVINDGSLIDISFFFAAIAATGVGVWKLAGIYNNVAKKADLKEIKDEIKEIKDELIEATDDLEEIKDELIED